MSFPARLLQYTRERFPLGAYVPMILTFTFSAAAFSRMARGQTGFIPWPVFAVGCFTSLVFFFWLRVLDEHKDADTDRQFRPELPVPRGLIRLGELRAVAVTLLVIALGLNAWLNPDLLWPCLAVAAWAALMTREFFVRAWLRAHVTWYLLSHMVIMPMIDFYTTGLDWIAAGWRVPPGLEFFLVVTFLNGVVIEVGRKIRAPEDEREGVDTYTQAWGLKRATVTWQAVLLLTAFTAALALRSIGAGPIELATLTAMFVLAGRTALYFRREPTPRNAKAIETASGLWTLGMYLLLGAGPFVVRTLG
ncbi:MAG: UbiA family prenyltransferase [Candidatus Eremiobacterota bacterium]